MLSQRIQASTAAGVLISGEDKVIVPSTKPNLFFAIKAFFIDRTQAW